MLAQVIRVFDAYHCSTIFQHPAGMCLTYYVNATPIINYIS